MARDDLTTAAQTLIGAEETIRAAGIFALQDNYAAITAGGVVTGIAMPAGASPLLEGAGAAAGIEAARQANAASKGVTERMLVAVTEQAIHILAMPVMGGMPQRRLMRFDRQSTEVDIKKFGLSRRVNLQDRASGEHLGLTGTTAPFSSASKGDKAVLAELQ